MENLRWILIFAGVAILVMLWISGRSGRRDSIASRAPDPLLGDDPLDARFGDFDDVDPGDLARPGVPAGGARVRRPNEPLPVGFGGDEGFDAERGDVAAYASEDPLEYDGPSNDDIVIRDVRTGERVAGQERHGIGILTRKFEAIGDRFAPSRRRRAVTVDDDVVEPAPKAVDSKIVTLHVVAPAGDILPPEALREVLERRGYHHGAMSIFHSLYRGETVFSIARMVKPGIFDLDDLETFETPGLAFILQLPGPVAADTAFEVMLDEAFGIADELDGAVLDGNRSTLGRQTQQHLREDIHEYMHRQKYIESVA